MPYTQTSTSLGALSSAASGSWVALPKNPGVPIVAIVATSVTTGAVVAIEGRERGTGIEPTAATSARELHRVTVAANGNVIIPIAAVTENMKLPDEVRITVVSRTDGTYTSSLLTNTNG